MTDFMVSPDALRTSADGVDSVAEGVDGIKGAMSPPPPLMCGVLVGGIVGNVLAQVTYLQSQALITGIAHSDRVMATMLRDTAELYDMFEDDAVKACESFTQEI